MSPWIIALLAACGSIVLIWFTYRASMATLQGEAVLQNWATINGLQIIRRESRVYRQGPFYHGPLYPYQYQVVFLVTVEDSQRTTKRAWVRVGWWYVIGFKENVDVRWDDS